MAPLLLYMYPRGMRNNQWHLTNKYVYTCLIVLSFLALALRHKTDIRYVNSLKDFKTHTSYHIQNVYRLGMWLYYENKETLFKDVPEAQLREYLLNHDHEKLATLEELQQFGYDNDKTFTERLYKYYGQNKEDNPEILPFMNELNLFDSYYDKLFFRKYGYLDSHGNPNIMAMTIMLIAKVADTVEREKDPITSEEMDLSEVKKANTYFTKALEKRLANTLAKNYHNIVPPHPLIYAVNARIYMVNTNSQGPTCHSLFN